MKISILTPTYNRANLLDKLYTSIIINKNNCDLEVEWLIMDDGSTDNTRTVIDEYSNESIMDVKYYYEENSGKMAALNDLTQKATGDLIMECDSDDYLSPNAFEDIKESLEECKDIGNTYALVFLKYDQDGNNMGNNFPDDKYESSMFDLYFKEGITGEKALVYNASIRKNYKYELQHNERFVTEASLHHKMDLSYNVKCFNKPIMICEYKPDGYSKNIDKVFIQNPYGYYEYFKDMFDQDMSGVIFNKRMYIYKQFILFAILSKQSHAISDVKGLFNKIVIAILYIPGMIATKMRFKPEEDK